MTELSSILSSLQKKIVLLYTDGGPDHRVMFLSVQLALIALYMISIFCVLHVQLPVTHGAILLRGLCPLCILVYSVWDL